MEIRQFQKSDWPQLWAMIEPVFRAGETYPYSPDISEQEAQQNWIETPQETWVAIENDEILGSYYIKPNQPGLGAHVCNCGYIVSEKARGKGIAASMCQHSQKQAVKLGFRAMQYNLVVATNEGAIALWKKLGFQVVGTLLNAFNSRKDGFVDALVMYKELSQ